MNSASRTARSTTYVHPINALNQRLLRITGIIIIVRQPPDVLQESFCGRLRGSLAGLPALLSLSGGGTGGDEREEEEGEGLRVRKRGYGEC